MGDVSAFTGLAQTIAFDGFGQDDCRPAVTVHGRFVSGINLPAIVAATQQFMNLLVSQVVDQFQQLRILSEEMFARVTAWLDGILLIIAIERFFHSFEQQAGLIRREKFVPVRSPD